MGRGGEGEPGEYSSLNSHTRVLEIIAGPAPAHHLQRTARPPRRARRDYILVGTLSLIESSYEHMMSEIG